MKRDKKEKDNLKISSAISKYYYPLSWTLCHICGYEFRLENGWKFLWTTEWIGDTYHRSYLYSCSKCLIDRNEAIDYLKNIKSLEKL